MKLIFLKPLLAIVFLVATINSYGQGGYCMTLYDQYYDCSANSFMVNTPACKEIKDRWSFANCVQAICNLPTITGSSPPFVNCGVNQGRYSYCMSKGLGKGRGYATPEQYCTGWAGPAE